MSLQLTLEKTTMFEKHKSEVSASDLLGGHDTTEGRDIPFIISRPPNFDNRGFVATDENFLKLIRSDKAEWLISNYPNAFLVLSIIALRAKRNKDSLSGMEPGDAIVDRKGTAKAAGITEDQFRVALAHLIKLNLVEIVFNPKVGGTQKRPIKIPMKSMIVNILNSMVFDINKNYESPSQSPSDPHQIPINKKERKKEEEKEKKYQKENSSIQKKEYREKVTLSEEQYAKLIAGHGEPFVNTMLDELSAYKCSNGKKYASDYHLMIGAGWVIKKCTEQKNAPTKIPRGDDICIELMKTFQNQEFYNEARCYIDNVGIAFQRGIKHKQIKFKEYGFWDQFRNMLIEFGIKYEFKH